MRLMVCPSQYWGIAILREAQLRPGISRLFRTDLSELRVAWLVGGVEDAVYIVVGQVDAFGLV